MGLRAKLMFLFLPVICTLHVPSGKAHWGGSEGSDGQLRYAQRNDIDWEKCKPKQVTGKSKLLRVAVNDLNEDLDESNAFTLHHGWLYRCDVGPNPIYLRFTRVTGFSTLLKLQWPTVLDANYLFATKTTERDRDAIGYGFRIAVCSKTRKRWHYRKFYFPTLVSLNDFIKNVAVLTNGQSSTLHKADFFKAPRYTVDFAKEDSTNLFGDHFFGNEDTEKLKAFDQNQPVFMRNEDGGLENSYYVRNTVQQYSEN